MDETGRTPTPCLGTLHVADGIGIVRLEARLDRGIDDLWAALTDPRHLGHWLGEIAGDFHQGGVLHARYAASGWEGDLRVERCDRPHRLVLRSASAEEASEGTIVVTLTADGDATILAIEDRGAPLAYISAYGAGDQIHLEDLAAYLDGRERCDARVRWEELHPYYQTLANGITATEA